MGEYYDENTLYKVRDALIDAHFENQVAAEIILTLQNAGILFREFTDEVVTNETTTEVTYEFMQPVSKDEFIRLECLHMATETIPLNRTGNEEQFITRARHFEQYVRSGAFEENKNA